MTTPEQGSLDPTALALPPLKLPALPSLPSRSFADHERYIIELREVMRCRERLLEARERILREALDFQAALVKELLPYQEEAVRLLARIAELEAVCAGHYANTVEALRQANEADAKALAFEADAARYRWLRNDFGNKHDTPYARCDSGKWKDDWLAGEHLDAAIDEARGAT